MKFRLGKVRLGKLVRVCPGKRHAWFESNVGLIRKPFDGKAMA